MKLGRRTGGHQSPSTGFSLVEILVTLVVVAIGLLGIAGLQITGIKLGYVAASRTGGVVLANDIIERIRSNVANASSYGIAFGSPSTATTTQAERDLTAWKAAVAAQLGGDGKVTVAQSSAAGCDDPLIAGCWDVTVELRWDESNNRGGSANATGSLLKLSTRL